MIVTRDYIMLHRTEAGSWTRPQLKALGVTWPPNAGWVERSIGSDLSDKNKWIFESKVTSKEAKNTFTANVLTKNKGDQVHVRYDLMPLCTNNQIKKILKTISIEIDSRKDF